MSGACSNDGVSNLQDASPAQDSHLPADARPWTITATKVPLTLSLPNRSTFRDISADAKGLMFIVGGTDSASFILRFDGKS